MLRTIIALYDTTSNMHKRVIQTKEGTQRLVGGLTVEAAVI